MNAIRALHPHTPVLIFGGIHCHTLAHEIVWVSDYRIYPGHTHIRDCQQYDGRSMAMESGRYMETIGTLRVSTVSYVKLIITTGWMSAYFHFPW